MRDIAIIGGGPAGLSCAITARKRGMDAAVIAPAGGAGWLARAEMVDNYPGLPGISGKGLLDAFWNQAKSLGAARVKGIARRILPQGKGFMLLVENDVIEARTVTLAMGAARPVLLPGEEESVGRGVSYCATCDGMLYRGKSVAVLSGTEDDEADSLLLLKLAASLDYYRLTPSKKAPPEGIRAEAGKPERIERGEDGGLMLTAGGRTTRYDGIFIFRRAVALDMLLGGLKTDGAFISVDRGMNTNIPGVFAAGDCTGKPLQIAKAVGEGNIAAISASEYIAQIG